MFPNYWCYRAVLRKIKYQKLGYYSTAEMYSLTVLEGRSLKPRCQQGHYSLEPVRKNPPLPPLTSGLCEQKVAKCPWCSLA